MPKLGDAPLRCVVLEPHRGHIASGPATQPLGGEGLVLWPLEYDEDHDSHSDQLTMQGNRFTELNEALSLFFAALDGTSRRDDSSIISSSG